MCIPSPGPKAQARQWDLSPDRPIVRMTAQRTFVNNRLAAVCGDATTAGVLMLGISPTVFIEGRGAHRRLDLNSNLSLTTTGSADTFVG